MNNLRLLAFLLVVLACMTLIGNGKTEFTTTKKETLDLQATSIPSPPVSNIPTPKGVNTALSTFVYPGSTLTSTSDNQIVLQSTGNITTITDWYTAAIQKNEMETHTFVRTNENGDIINKLNSTSGEKEINVIIEKMQHAADTTITVRTQ